MLATPLSQSLQNSRGKVKRVHLKYCDLIGAGGIPPAEKKLGIGLGPVLLPSNGEGGDASLNKRIILSGGSSGRLRGLEYPPGLKNFL